MENWTFEEADGPWWLAVWKNHNNLLRKRKKWTWIRVHVVTAINHHFINMNYSLEKPPSGNDSLGCAVLPFQFELSLTQYFECQTPVVGFVCWKKVTVFNGAFQNTQGHLTRLTGFTNVKKLLNSTQQICWKKGMNIENMREQRDVFWDGEKNKYYGFVVGGRSKGEGAEWLEGLVSMVVNGAGAR